MLIERIDIENFGKLRNIHIQINNRITVFYGPNESGKSTIAAFIKFMFFGYTGIKESKLDQNEKKLYTSWDSNKIAGSLFVFYKDRRYKIVREHTEIERTHVIDLSTNTRVPEAEAGQPGEFFFKMSEDSFTKTAFLKQLGTAEIGGEELSVAIHNILFTADEDLNTQKTLQHLVDAKGILSSELADTNENAEDEENKTKHIGMIDNLEKIRAELHLKLETSQKEQRELFKIEGNIKDLEEKILANNAKKNELEDELENYKAYHASQELQNIETAKKHVETLKQAEQKVIEKHAHGEFVPTMEFSRTLLDYAEKVSEKKEKLRRSTEQHNISLIKYTECAEKSQNFKVIENAGGVDEIGAEYIKKKSKAKKLNVLKILSIVLAVLTVAGSAALYFLDIFTNLAVLGIGIAGFAFFAVILALLEKQAKADIVEYYEMFDFKSESDFAYVLDDYPDTEAQLSILQHDLDTCSADVLEKQKAFDEVYSDARELLLQWNRTPDSDDKKAEDFIKYANLASEAAEEIQRATSLYEQHKQKLDFTLEGVDERALRKLAAAARKPNYDENDIIRKRDFIEKQNRNIREKAHEQSGKASAITKLPDPAILKSQIGFLDNKIADLTTKQNALSIAIDALAQSCVELRNSVSPTLSKDAGDYFKIITGSKYEDLFVDAKMNMSFEASAILNRNSSNSGDTLKRSIDYLSAGTRDAAYLCLRMALLDLLFENDMPPLICDESFLRMDNTRLENLVKILSALSRKTQIFLFTCHEREVKLFGAMTEAAILTM